MSKQQIRRFTTHACDDAELQRFEKTPTFNEWDLACWDLFPYLILPRRHAQNKCFLGYTVALSPDHKEGSRASPTEWRLCSERKRYVQLESSAGGHTWPFDVGRRESWAILKELWWSSSKPSPKCWIHGQTLDRHMVGTFKFFKSVPPDQHFRTKEKNINLWKWDVFSTQRICLERSLLPISLFFIDYVVR